MPWCNECDRFYTPSTLKTDGTCPEGHHAVDPPPDAGDLPEDRGLGAPWHFWLMVVALVAYLGWRLVQGIAWAVGQL